jgi:hypothetical protein
VPTGLADHNQRWKAIAIACSLCWVVPSGMALPKAHGYVGISLTNAGMLDIRAVERTAHSIFLCSRLNLAPVLHLVLSHSDGRGTSRRFGSEDKPHACPVGLRHAYARTLYSVVHVIICVHDMSAHEQAPTNKACMAVPCKQQHLVVRGSRASMHGYVLSRVPRVSTMVLIVARLYRSTPP